MVAGRPRLADRVPGGVSRRRHTTRRLPPAIAPPTTAGSTPELIEARANAAPATTPKTGKYGTDALRGRLGAGTCFMARTASTPDTTTNGTNPKKTHRQLAAAATRAAIAGPIRPGMTHAVDRMANIRGWHHSG